VYSTPAEQQPEAESSGGYQQSIKKVENEFVSAYQSLEAKHVEMTQKHSEEYAKIFHLQTKELVKHHQKLSILKDQFPQNARIATAKIFSDPSSTSPAPSKPPAEHPMIELKKLQKKIQEVRAELQKLVDQEYRL
jgi:hypothetical protein